MVKMMSKLPDVAEHQLHQPLLPGEHSREVRRSVPALGRLLDDGRRLFERQCPQVIPKRKQRGLLKAVHLHEGNKKGERGVRWGVSTIIIILQKSGRGNKGRGKKQNVAITSAAYERENATGTAKSARLGMRLVKSRMPCRRTGQNQAQVENTPCNWLGWVRMRHVSTSALSSAAYLSCSADFFRIKSDTAAWIQGGGRLWSCGGARGRWVE